MLSQIWYDRVPLMPQSRYRGYTRETALYRAKSWKWCSFRNKARKVVYLNSVFVRICLFVCMSCFILSLFLLLVIACVFALSPKFCSSPCKFWWLLYMFILAVFLVNLYYFYRMTSSSFIGVKNQKQTRSTSFLALMSLKL